MPAASPSLPPTRRSSASDDPQPDPVMLRWGVQLVPEDATRRQLPGWICHCLRGALFREGARPCVVHVPVIRLLCWCGGRLGDLSWFLDPGGGEGSFVVCAEELWPYVRRMVRRASWWLSKSGCTATSRVLGTAHVTTLHAPLGDPLLSGLSALHRAGERRAAALARMLRCDGGRVPAEFGLTLGPRPDPGSTPGRAAVCSPAQVTGLRVATSARRPG